MRSREIFFNFLSSVRQRKAAAVVEAAAHARLKKFNARTPLEGKEGGGGGEHSSRPRERGFFVSDDKYISKHTRNGLERRRVAATTTGDWPICETRATRVATHLFAVPELDYYNTFTNYALPCRGRTQARFFPPLAPSQNEPEKTIERPLPGTDDNFVRLFSTSGIRRIRRMETLRVIQVLAFLFPDENLFSRNRWIRTCCLRGENRFSPLLLSLSERNDQIWVITSKRG